MKSGKIKPKFDGTIRKFLLKDFADIFMNPDYTISDFRLWLVTNRRQTIPKGKEGSSRLDADMENRCGFMGKSFSIQRLPPDEAWVGTDLA
uniref:Uncharacterized protein n=1 Tax=Candidatus Kentrum sp. SD TaxID=2126332 RepID=A0A450Y4Q1_9GAMM|nr:MAG: hypothetical protein BECKSD772F_GA0070984_100260 [Candidatus Kentron sp. SD]VFK39246.1 MAG: hypothetical protein BECKSD772E_GA0070983_100258 [Candidatus Kentron sp. SD]VFK77842.1 MAG: hypothetical protein BECKSD772D_GA0070982_100256 [Candidatus Kentron sp. SD]